MLNLRLRSSYSIRNGCAVTVQGHERDITDLVRPAVDALAQQVLTFARDRWGRARDSKQVILTAGGAWYITEAVKKVYPHKMVISDPHLGDLRGFHKYARRKFG